MAFGLGRLGWPPERFWAATPREISAALQAYQSRAGATAPPRHALDRLMAIYPDVRDGTLSHLERQDHHGRL